MNLNRQTIHTGSSGLCLSDSTQSDGELIFEGLP
ncbi:hypothetical protein DVU_1832 [Nitratidesulfovibrio vulgaris str. Hildenborough]|uniref:Uncharacterized protein n=1 Tax=Nitratidesulfovibrio vulgaris (strain ATCC 29579 / DSM 644 / CCUG 34227 / NCIMB 8303 / VKM B-1760 / Hildenborough) TaxID=882 RepID=Q72B08_NITV2|nr:hypothetical protein DVU_1832 [Nitratidesulfovibrio vulgaris str. Hildenborough]